MLEHLKEDGHNLTVLGIALSQITEPLVVTAKLYDDELTEGFHCLDAPYNRYQVLYLALNTNNEFYLTTSPKEAQAHIPVTNIYDYGFERAGVSRDAMNNISRTYARELRHFVFNHTHKYIAAMVTGGIEEVAVVIAPEAQTEHETA